MGQSRYVHLEDCWIMRETESAFLIGYEGEEHWIQKSQIANPEVYDVDDEGVTVSITEWIAEQKGIDA